MSEAPEVPADVLAVDVAERSVAMRVDAKAYPVDAIYGAAYIFLDRCWVLLDRPDAGHVRVTLAWKGDPAAGALQGAVHEFAEELVSCAWRAGLAKDTRALIEGATAKAHSGAEVGAGPSLDDLASFDFGGDAVKDPLSLAQSWEEKQKKETGPAPSNEKTEPSEPEPAGTRAPKEGA
jgi:His-Xaa-Ser system protein HxsD